MTTFIAIAIALPTLGAIVLAFSRVALATKHEKLADALDVAHEALDVAGKCAEDLRAGKDPAAIIHDIDASGEAQDLLRRFRVLAHLSALLLAFTLSGCASMVQLESTAHATAVTADNIVTAIETNQKTVDAAMVELTALAGKNATAAQAISVAQSYITSGNLTAAHAVLALIIVETEAK